MTSPPTVGDEVGAARRGPRAIRRVVFALIPILVVLAGIEGVARLFVAEEPDSPLLIPGGDGDWKRSELHRFDPVLVWRNRESVDIVYKGVRVVTNSFGMRSPAVSHRKAPGALRVLSLGESTAFGSKVGQDEMYASVLARCLGERLEGRQVEVLNAGTPGWSIVQSWAYLRDEGLGFAPDIVLLYHGYNDFLPTGFTSRRSAPSSGTQMDQDGTGQDGTGRDGQTDLAIIGRPRGGLRRAADWLREHSAAVRWFSQRMRSMADDASKDSASKDGVAQGGALVDGAPEDGTARAERSIEDAKAKGGDAVSEGESVRVPEADRVEVLGRILELCRTHGADLVILVPCYRRFTDHRAVLLDFAADHGVPVIDMQKAIDALGTARDDLFADDSHPTAALHAQYGALLCESLAERIQKRD